MELIIFWLACAILSAIVASSKGRSAGGWLILGLVFGLLALIVVAVISSKKPPPVLAGAEAASALTHVRCPDCRELVRKDARRCKHCGITLTPQPIE